jgi:hypothetical protein
MQETPAMTWSRLKEKLRAHGMPGWCDELPDRALREVSAAALAIWEGEGGRTVALRPQQTGFTGRATHGADGPRP